MIKFTLPDGTAVEAGSVEEAAKLMQLFNIGKEQAKPSEPQPKPPEPQPNPSEPAGNSPQGSGVSPEDGPKVLDGEELYEAALDVVRRTNRASTSSLQRYLRIKYIKAAQLIDRMEEEGIIGPPRGAEPREVFIDFDNPTPLRKQSEAQLRELREKAYLEQKARLRRERERQEELEEARRAAEMDGSDGDETMEADGDETMEADGDGEADPEDDEAYDNRTPDFGAVYEYMKQFAVDKNDNSLDDI